MKEIKQNNFDIQIILLIGFEIVALDFRQLQLRNYWAILESDQGVWFVGSWKKKHGTSERSTFILCCSTHSTVNKNGCMSST